MKTLIVGSNGQLGRALSDSLPKSHKADLPEIDITDASLVSAYLKEIKPEVIFNAAAHTDVERAEDDQAHAFAVNELGVKNLALSARELGAILVHVSTDYVFDGLKMSEYLEDDKPSPLNIYGKSKFAGETAAANNPATYVVRTAWLYGDGKNFVRTMLRLFDENDEVRVISDQIGSPTYASDLANALVDIVNRRLPYGTYHCVNSGHCSWYELAKKTSELSGKKIRIIPVPSSQYATKASRPAYTPLSNKKLQAMGIKMRSWKEALEEYLVQ